mmetsp:Transcript_39812/g.81535  ORF Transcript_39812/g.81535 Transcript_39812/m.81535 type:complete len:99 (-) Transcript_39812:171-467(-)
MTLDILPQKELHLRQMALRQLRHPCARRVEESFRSSLLCEPLLANQRHVDMRCALFQSDCRFPVMIAPSPMHGQAQPDIMQATAWAAVRAGSAFRMEA